MFPKSILQVNWLIDDALETDTYTYSKVDTQQQLPIPKQVGSGCFESLELAHGITLFRSSYRFEKTIRGQLIPLALIHSKFEEPTLMLQTLSKGRVIQLDPALPHSLIYGNGFDLFRYGIEFSATPTMDTTEDIEMTAVVIGKSSLQNLLGNHLFEKLISGLNLQNSTSAVTREIPKFISRTLSQCMSPEYAGELKKLMAQAKVLEYLTQLMEFLGGDSTDSWVRKPTNTRIEKLYDYLVNLEGKLPTLNSLATKFNRSARMLNDEFKEMYGESIFVFIVNYRLNQAHEAIKNSPIPLKLLARKLGYSHVNHFITAFKKKFGYSPGSLRK